MDSRIETVIYDICSNVKCKMAHRAIREEYLDHIENSVISSVSQGMNEDVAVVEAIRNLGDPTEIGIELDKRHRLETPWPLIATTLLMILFGASMAFIMPNALMKIGMGLSFAMYASIALIAMLAMMSINYQWLFKLRIPLYLGILALILIDAKFNWELRIYDSKYFLFALPLSGMLFNKKGGGWVGIFFFLAILAFSGMLFWRSSTSGALCMMLALGASVLAAGY